MPQLGLTLVENAGNGDCLFVALVDAFKWMGIGGATAKDVRARIADFHHAHEADFAAIWGGLSPQGAPCSWLDYGLAIM